MDQEKAMTKVKTLEQQVRPPFKKRIFDKGHRPFAPTPHKFEIDKISKKLGTTKIEGHTLTTQHTHSTQPICPNCRKVGHTCDRCRAITKACFKCGKPGHQVGVQKQNVKVRTRAQHARVHVMTCNEAATTDIITDIPMVCEFLNVFLVDLPSLPLDREIEFAINFVPNIDPISKAPYRFMDLMKRIFSKYLDKFVVAFIDNILIYSFSHALHKEHLRTILEMLRNKRLFVTFKNFLGLAGYCHQFVEDFSTIALPMTRLNRKDTKFEWTLKCAKSFLTLKEKLVAASILALLISGEGFTIYSDASKNGLGCVLIVGNGGICTQDQEALSLWRWLELLNDYDLTISYHPSKANKVTDVLSRKSSSTASNILATKKELLEDLAKLDVEFRLNITKAYLADLSAQPALINRIKLAQQKDPFLQRLKEKVNARELHMQELKVYDDETLWFGDKLCVPRDGGCP
ncbi:hypothetical protein SLEP1_g18794 [Rubroshorea leprosula]|uniref:Reverse transcriptase/retrotransposon-derived protein RNase H-like domain-containing protein n=1 Tax=Rubroshorea leprosula TaxID=152421 RepID=A0AAV5J7Y3_9ROSI|nr:hypothetical protein SLEP1_g18794 [Rubroshorea leprosula]